MKSLPLVALLLAATASSAHAGGYIGLGVGDGIATTGDLEYSAEGRTLKLIGGFAFGKLAVEGSAQRADVLMVDAGRAYSLTQLGLAAKYSYPLSDGFELYGKLGLNRIALDPKADGLDGTGSGILAGGGVEYRSKLPVTFWLDYTLTNADISMGADYAMSTRQWMIGASLGL
ncbi:MAG: outer membrane beta-barrel protein [Myxococcales bacterium]|nr:outer membrane beta-barrel protein [Myxococcales bacterium]